MRNITGCVAVALAMGMAMACGAEPVKVIFDTDMYTDFDDVGALACLHALQDAGECEILATVSCTRDCRSVAMCEIINAFYGRPEIPVGCVRGIGVGNDRSGAHERAFGATVEKFAKWVRHANSSDAPDAAEVYRRVLSAQPDGSVVICSVGFLSNLRKLVEADRDLVARKVKRWVAMACSYPKGKEYNSKLDWESSKIALERWPTEIVFTDFQYGMDCFAGRAVAESPVRENPVADVFRRMLPSRGQVRADAGRYLCGHTGVNGRAAWDETAVLIAVRGTDGLFNIKRGTYRMVGTEGEDEWVPDEENGRHLRVTEKVDKAEVGALIDRLICRGPKAGPRCARMNDPYDYKELVATASHPVEVSPGLFDFGTDGFGWLELHGAPAGMYTVTLGEMTNAQGWVANPFPGSTIRCQRISRRVGGDVYRFGLPVDAWNTIGYDAAAPAITLPKWAGVVFPFRYVQFTAKGGDVKARNLVRKMVHYPIDMDQSSFTSDSDVLNRIYDFCKHSILATSFCGVYVDGDRERTPYEGDAYVNQLCQYAIDADCSLARKSHEWLLEHPTWPTEWKQLSISMAWADWMWTGDRRSLEKYYGKLRKKLLGNFPRQDIVDWPVTERDGFVMTNSNAVVDALNCRNLEEMADIAAAIGRAADARDFAARARTAKTKYLADYFDTATGLFADSVEVRHVSLHANAAALAFGLVPDDHVPGVVSFLEKKGMACSVYFAQYLLEALCRAGRADLAVRLMTAEGDRGWKGMMDFGSTITMEAWSPKVKPNLDLNHAWGAVPLNIISRFILGVTPLEPGFARISVRPAAGGLKSFRGKVPTNAGTVEVAVEGTKLRVVVPAPAEVVWKGRTHAVTAGIHEFGK